MEKYKNIVNFTIAEFLACIAFVLTSANVILAKEMHVSGAPVWMPDFGLVYWIKTILAMLGLCYVFMSKVFANKENPKYIAVLTIILLLYSLPIVNMLFSMPFEALFSTNNKVHEQGITYQSRIPTIAVWAIPFFIVAADIFKKSLRIKKFSR